MTAVPKPRYLRMTLSEFQRHAYAGKPQSRNTIKAAIRNGYWLGEKVNGTYLIFVDAQGQPIPGNGPRTGNEEADRLILGYNQTVT